MGIVTVKDLSVLLGTEIGPGRYSSLTAAQGCLIAGLWRAAGACAVDLVITCGREDHPAGDPHTLGAALDVSVHGLNAPQIARLFLFLGPLLGPKFTVLFECPAPPDPTNEPQLAAIAYVNRGASARHFHLQVRNGVTWPPVESAPASGTVPV